MDLSTNYLGIPLANPLMPGSSPLADDMDVVRRLEDAGAAAIVLRSLFEEQLVLEQLAAAQLLDRRRVRGRTARLGLGYLGTPIRRGLLHRVGGAGRCRHLRCGRDGWRLGFGFG